MTPPAVAKTLDNRKQTRPTRTRSTTEKAHPTPITRMAKLGEGDERWIVNERGDGANVNNWHWQEKDAFEWARDRFNHLLVLTVAEGVDPTTLQP